MYHVMIPPHVQQWIKDQLTALKYEHTQLAFNDIVSALNTFSSLRPKTEFVGNELLLCLFDKANEIPVKRNYNGGLNVQIAKLINKPVLPPPVPAKPPSLPQVSRPPVPPKPNPNPPLPKAEMRQIDLMNDTTEVSSDTISELIEKLNLISPEKVDITPELNDLHALQTRLDALEHELSIARETHTANIKVFKSKTLEAQQLIDNVSKFQVSADDLQLLLDLKNIDMDKAIITNRVYKETLEKLPDCFYKGDMEFQTYMSLVRELAFKQFTSRKEFRPPKTNTV